MTSNSELVRLTDTAKALGLNVERKYDFSEGRSLIESVTLDGVTLDPISAAERLRPVVGPARPSAPEPVTLEWKREFIRGRRLWRLYAPRAVLAAIGGAPCHVGTMIATVSQDAGLWQGRAELTPYHTEKTPAGREEKTKARLEALISDHLQGLGFGSVNFAEV